MRGLIHLVWNSIESYRSYSFRVVVASQARRQWKLKDVRPVCTSPLSDLCSWGQKKSIFKIILKPLSGLKKLLKIISQSAQNHVTISNFTFLQGRMPLGHTTPSLLFSLPPPPFIRAWWLTIEKTNTTVNHTKMCSARVINYPVSDQKVYILISEIVFSTLVFNLP